MSSFLAGLLFLISGGIWIWMTPFKPSSSALYTGIGLLLVALGVVCIMTSLVKRPAKKSDSTSSSAKETPSR